jgi:hydrogenase-4 component F
MLLGIYFALAAIISAVFFTNRKIGRDSLWSVIFLLIQTALTILIINKPELAGQHLFYADKLSRLLLVILLVLSYSSVYYSFPYLNTRNDSSSVRRTYFVALVIFIAALTGAYLSNHFGLMWIFIELTTLSASMLIYHHRTEKALEGAWKYLFVCTLSITLVFIGILFLAQASKGIDGADLSYAWLTQHASELNPFWLKAAFLFIFVGFTAKSGIVPMFSAGVDAKDKAPTPIAALLSSVLLNGGFLGIFRIFQIVSHSSILSWASGVAFISGILSVFVAAIYMLKIKHMKRMLAYSSIEHMGLITIGFAVGGIGYFAALLHLIIHSFAKSSVFYQLGQISRIYHTMDTREAGEYYILNKAGAIVLIIGFFCITALPPTGLFLSEFMILQSLIQTGHYVTISILLILMAFIVYAIGKNIFQLLFGQNNVTLPEGAEKIPFRESAVQLVLLAVVVVLGIWLPQPLCDYLNGIVSVFQK